MNQAESPVINHRLPRSQLIAFALPGFVSSFIFGPIGGILPTLYAKNFGIDLAFIGLILFASRFFDMLTDPIIGHLSDKTKTRIGRRKPWIIAGSLISLLGVYRLFIPSENPDGWYYLLWFMLLYLAWTMSEIPYNAWVTELTRDYNERARIITFRNVSGVIGAIGFAAVPLLPGFSSSEMTFDVLKYVAWFVMIVFPLAVIIAMVWVPQGKHVAVTEKVILSELYDSLRSNRPFWAFAFVFVSYGLGTGLYGALKFMFLDTYLLIGNKVSYFLIANYAMALASMPIWLKLIYTFGKHRAWAASSFGIALFTIPMLAIPPGPGAFIPFLTLSLLVGFAMGGGMVAPMAMLADLIDYDILKTGTNRAGSYFAISTMMVKANAAFGAAMGFWIIGWFNYDVQVKTHALDERIGLFLAFVILPAVFFLITGLIAWHFPINAKRQAIIAKRIQQRAERAARANPTQEHAPASLQ